jgi:hypothetical protein
MARLSDSDEAAAYSGSSYSELVQAKRAQTEALKGKGKPLGGAPPLEKEKMAKLAKMIAPAPSFDREVIEPPVTGVGDAYQVNKEVARASAPITLKQAQENAEKHKKLSPETVEGLKRAAEAAKKEQGPDFQDPTEEEMDEVAEEATSPPEFDFAAISSHREFLISKKRREEIEKKLAPLDLADMVTRREIQQNVPVVDDKLNYTFRTFNQHEHLFCLRYIYDFPGSSLYVNELLSTCKLVCTLVAINGALLPDHRKDVGSSKEQVDRDMFVKKMFHVASFPTQMIADMSVQAVWFDERVSKLFSLENLKNG